MLWLAHFLCRSLCLLIWRNEENLSSSFISAFPPCTLHYSLTHSLALLIQLERMSPRKEIIAGGATVRPFSPANWTPTIQLRVSHAIALVFTHLSWYINLPPHPHFFFFPLSLNQPTPSSLPFASPPFLPFCSFFLPSFLTPHFH